MNYVVLVCGLAFEFDRIVWFTSFVYHGNQNRANLVKSNSYSVPFRVRQRVFHRFIPTRQIPKSRFGRGEYTAKPRKLRASCAFDCNKRE